MDFYNPGLLWALPFGLVPIIIYYLMRFRSLKVTWGADYVLQRALERLRKKLYLDQLLLLAARVLAGIFLVLAFARPVSPSKDAIISSSGIHRVILVDTSYSMEAEDQSGSVWQRSREILRQLVSTWGRGETWSLCRVAETPEWVVEDATVTTPAATRARIDRLAPADTSAALAKALEEVAARFAGSRVELYLFTDDQATTWEGVAQATWPGGSPPPIYWVCPPLEERANLAVTAVQPGGERPLARHPSRTFVAVRNFGTEPVTDLPVELLLDGTYAGRESISLLPGQAGTVHFDLVPEVAGSHRLTARLGRDVLPRDNEMTAGIEVIDRIQVAILRDREQTGKFDSAWSFLEIVGRLAAARDEDDRPLYTMGPCVFTLATPDTQAKALAKADVLLLDGGRTLDKALVAALRQAVQRGAGLVLAADERIDSAAWNRLLAPAGLLPARLGRLHIETLGGPRRRTLNRADLGVGPLRAFETAEDGDLAKAHFYTWYDLAPADRPSTVYCRFADHQPYLVGQRGEGGGKVLLLAAGLNARSNNLLVREFCLPFLIRLFSQAAEGGILPRTVDRNTPVRLRLPADAELRAATWNAEGREPVPVTPVPGPQGVLVAAPAGLGAIGASSLLLVDDEGTRRVWFGVQGERVDSDLTPLDSNTRRAVTQQLGVQEVKSWEELNSLLQANRRGTEWHVWAMLALVLLLGAEMLLQRKFT